MDNDDSDKLMLARMRGMQRYLEEPISTIALLKDLTFILEHWRRIVELVAKGIYGP